jgi:hypothetical protein
MMLEEAAAMNKDLNFSVLLCGDLNASPDTIVYDMLTKRQCTNKDYSLFLLPKDHFTDTANNLSLIVNESLSGTLRKDLENRELSDEDKKRLEDAEKFMEETYKKFPPLYSVYSTYTSLTDTPKPSDLWQGEPAYTRYHIVFPVNVTILIESFFLIQ